MDSQHTILYHKNPLVSVITPCYNSESYIQKFLQSLSRQTYKNIELIFINDGSTDSTESIIKKALPNLNIHSYIYIYIYILTIVEYQKQSIQV